MKSEIVDNVHGNLNLDYVPKEEKKVSVHVHAIDPVREVDQTMWRIAVWAHRILCQKNFFIFWNSAAVHTPTLTMENVLSNILGKRWVTAPMMVVMIARLVLKLLDPLLSMLEEVQTQK